MCSPKMFSHAAFILKPSKTDIALFPLILTVYSGHVSLGSVGADKFFLAQEAPPTVGVSIPFYVVVYCLAYNKIEILIKWLLNMSI